MLVTFAGEEVEIRDLIARCLEANYTGFGFADSGEAEKVANRLLSVLDQLGCEIVRKAR